MSHMVDSFVVGVVNVKGYTFKDHCLSYPKQLLSTLNSELPNLVVGMCNQLSYDIKVTDKYYWLHTHTHTIHSYIHCKAILLAYL